MTTWHRHRTTVDSITAQLIGIGTLTGVTAVTGRVCLCSDPSTVASLPGTIVSSPNAIVSLTLNSWLPTAELGPWALTWHPLFTNGARPILPERGTDTIVVVE